MTSITTVYLPPTTQQAKENQSLFSFLFLLLQKLFLPFLVTFRATAAVEDKHDNVKCCLIVSANLEGKMGKCICAY